jgi:3-deoxy-D-manno-octulosonate 8-phosphate phosphatase (KDO 8-P phosphatase)
LIQLLVLDVDGCLTDGGICYTENGDEEKTFNVKDGLAIASWIRMGKDVAIITGRSSNIVKKRAKELGITQIYQGVKDKKTKLKEILLDLGLTLENVAAIGDDLNDYAMLKSVKKSFTPNDGATDIKKIADITLLRDGGDGAVREMIEIILKDEDIYEDFLNLWL